MPRALDKNSEHGPWVTTSQAFFSKQQSYQYSVPAGQNVASKNRHRSIDQYSEKMMTKSLTQKAFGKATDTTNEWKTCSRNFLKKYRTNIRDHNILTLECQSRDNNTNQQPKPSQLRGAPIRNLFNVVNNQRIPESLIKNRDILLPIQHHRKLLSKQVNEYNIISGDLKLSHNNQQKLAKINNCGSYNPIFAKFSDEMQQNAFWQRNKQIEKQKIEHAKNRKLPPSYLNRQQLQLDRTKPTSDGSKLLDQQRINAKKRYQLKYKMQRIYDQRNQDLQQHKDSIIRNKMAQNKLLQAKSKYDILNHNKIHIESKLMGFYEHKHTINDLNTIKSNGFRSII